MPKHRVKRHSVTQPSDPSYRLIPLTRGQNAIVDTSDYDWLNQWNWCAQWNPGMKSFYAVRSVYGGTPSTIKMHRQILDCKKNKDGDHKNHNTLDNRRKNLRKATTAQNIQNKKKPSNNTSGYKGVTWDKGRNKWSVRICTNGKHKFLGQFTSIISAAKIYDAAAKQMHKKFACINF